MTKMKKNHYINDNNGKEYYDYCENCQRKVEQVDLGDGSYGCEFCRSDGNITIHEVKKAKQRID